MTIKPATLALAALACFFTPARAQSCLSNADTANTYSTYIKRYLTDVDSVDVVGVGLPFSPTTTTLVTNDVDCSRAIARYNERYPSAPVSQTYLFLVQSRAYAMVNLVSPQHPRYTFLTKRFVVIYDMMQLD